MAAPGLLGGRQDVDATSLWIDFTPTFDAFAAGDLLVVVGTTSQSLAGTTNSTGWTQRQITAATYQLFVYSHVATGSTDVIPTFTVAGYDRYSWTTFHFAAGTYDTGTPFESFTDASGSSNNPVAPSSTSGGIDRLRIVAATSGGDGTPGRTWTAPSGHTLIGAGHSIDYLGHAAAQKTISAAGTTGTATFGFAPGNDWRAISFLVRPSVASGPITLTPAVVHFSAVPLTITPGAVATSLIPALLHFEARPLTISRAGDPQTVNLAPALLTFSAVPLIPVALELAPDIERNELWRRLRGTTGDGIRIAVSLPAQGRFKDFLVGNRTDYEYRHKAIRVDGAVRFSEWVTPGAYVAPLVAGDAPPVAPPDTPPPAVPTSSGRLMLLL